MASVQASVHGDTVIHDASRGVMTSALAAIERVASSTAMMTAMASMTMDNRRSSALNMKRNEPFARSGTTTGFFPHQIGKERRIGNRPALRKRSARSQERSHSRLAFGKGSTR